MKKILLLLVAVPCIAQGMESMQEKKEKKMTSAEHQAMKKEMEKKMSSAEHQAMKEKMKQKMKKAWQDVREDVS